MVALSQFSYPDGNFKGGGEVENAKLPLRLSHMKEGITVGLWLLSLLSSPILLFLLLKTHSNTDVWGHTAFRALSLVCNWSHNQATNGTINAF